MKKQKKLIVGNWKMNPESLDEARKIAGEVKRAMSRVTKTSVVLCPPFVYLPSLSKLPSKSIFLGAQNANHERLGAFTGEVSWSELYQFNVRFVIVGHSERRRIGETDEIVNKKVKSVVNDGMTAIVCIGEDKRDKNGDYFNIIRNQIHIALRDVSKTILDKVVIAYEPIWTVGAPEAMSPRELLETSIYIKKVLKDMFGSPAEYIRILYGGDADRINSEPLVREGGVSGLLVGRESLRSKDFIDIIKSVDAI